MAWEVRIERDSINPKGKRLTTFVCTYPRFIHAEVLTHRMMSRNSASSRAIPIEKTIQRVLDDPAMPIHWGANQKGMQASGEVEYKHLANFYWLSARDSAVDNAKVLHHLGLHKQIVNRILEPFSWITTIISATEWDNFFHLRVHKDAQPEFQHLAAMMAEAYFESKPVPLPDGYWHQPFTTEEDIDLIMDWLRSTYTVDGVLQSEHMEADNNLLFSVMAKVSAARCARVSYLTHEGKRDIGADMDLFNRLMKQIPHHASPLEHVACSMDDTERRGNFIGWTQLRKTYLFENLVNYTPDQLDRYKKSKAGEEPVTV